MPLILIETFMFNETYTYSYLSSSFERTTPIWFNKLLNKNEENGDNFLDARKRIFDAATTHSLFDIIALGQQINEENLAHHITFFKEHLSGLSPRLADIYGIYRLLAQEVCLSIITLKSLNYLIFR